MKKRKQFFEFVLAYNIVLLIPLLIISVSVMHLLKNQQQHALEHQARARLKRQAGIWTQQLAIMRQFNKHCKYDKKYNEGYSERPEAFFNICEELKEQNEKNPFVDGIYVLDKDKGLVFSARGILYAQFFFGQICRLKEDDIAQALHGEEVGTPIAAFQAQFPSEKDEGLVFVSPIRTWGKEGVSEKIIFYTVSNEQLRLHFGDTPEGSHSVLLYDERPLYASLSLDSSLRPEDDMPGEQDVPGTESISEQSDTRYFFFSEAFGEKFSGVFIVSKAYLIRNVVVYVKGYALWLFSSLVIGSGLALWFSKNRYRSFQKLLHSNAALEQEKRELARQTCLYELLLKGVTSGDSLWNSCLQNDIYLQRRYKCLCILPDKLMRDSRIKKYLEKRSEPNDCLDAYSVEHMKNMRVLLLCSDRLQLQFRSVLEGLVQKGHKIGIGRDLLKVEELRNSYEEIRAQCAVNTLLDYGYPEQTILSLKEVLAENNKSKILLLLEELMAYTRNFDEKICAGLMWDLARLFSWDICDLTREWCEDKASPKGLVQRIVKQESERIHEALRQKNVAGHEWQVSRFDCHRRSAIDIVRYIDEHCLDDNFSTKQLAFYFDTSVSNISHFFKKNIGMTISQYVTRLKLEKAKMLLRDGHNKIADIAQILGYSNGTTFIEMFKKYEGITPGAFRISALSLDEA